MRTYARLQSSLPCFGAAGCLAQRVAGMLFDMITESSLLALFLMGAAGTGHCIGMCGPLVLAIPGQAGRLFPHLLYHSGRLSTYAATGAAVGAAGAALTGMAGDAAGGIVGSVARVQVVCSLFSAAFLLAFGLLRLGILQEPAWLARGSPSRIPGFRAVLQAVMAGKSRAAILAFGWMMGFLPCGLSYAAFAMAMPAGGAGAGALYLLAFGAGTLPGLLLVGTGASSLFRRYRRQSDLVAGALMLGIAVSLAADALQALLG
ncbi:MAG: sulfite exporter TauE/SafE family protein [bacterium]